MSSVKTPAIPTPPMSDPALAPFLIAVKSVLDNLTGAVGSDKAAVTQQALTKAINTAVSAVQSSAPATTSTTTTTTPDLTPPPAMTGLSATSGLSTVILAWDPIPPYGDHAYVTIYRAAVDDFSQASPVGTSRYLIYSDYVPDMSVYYYWITATSAAGVEGPVNQAAGVAAQASQDPTYVLQVLSSALTETELASNLRTRLDKIETTESGLAQEVTDRTNAINAEASTRAQALIDEANARAGDISTVQAQINDLVNTPAYDAGTAYTEDELVTYGGALYRALGPTMGNLPTDTNYWAKVGNYDSLGAAVGDHQSRITTVETVTSDAQSGNAALATRATALESTVNDPITGVAANASGLSALDTRVTAAEGAITSQSSDITALENTVNNPTTGVAANSSAISGLDSRVTAAEGTITSQASDITTLQSDLATANGNITANAGALSTLDTRVTAAEGTITSQATAITQLESSRGGANILPQQWTDFQKATSVPTHIFAIRAALTLYTGSLRVKGSQNILIEATGADAYVYLSDRIDKYGDGVFAVKPSTTYMCSMLVHLHSTNSPNLVNAYQFYLRELDEDGIYLGHRGNVISATTTANAERVYGTITTSANAALAIARVDLDAYSGNGPVYATIDELMIEELAPGQTEPSQFSYGASTAIIQTQATSIDGLEAQYTVKTDVNGHVAGYGLANTAAEANGAESNFIIMVDRFGMSFPAHPWAASTSYTLGVYVAPSTATGFIYEATAVTGNSGASEPTWPTTLGGTVVDGGITWTARYVEYAVPFVVDIVNGVKTIGINGQIIVDGSIVGTAIQAGSITADRITTSELAAFSANLGMVTAGMLKSPDSTFIIDLTAKEIIITGPAGQSADDYTIIKNGKVESYEWNGSTHLLSKALTHIEVGVANNNTVVQIPGYFASQPKILVTPKSIQVYDASNPSQSQTLECAAESITEYATGQWQFTAKASLVFSDSSGTATPNWANGSTSAATVTSPTYVMPANATQVTVNVLLNSSRGTGTAPNYYYRTATWTVYYRLVGAGTWTTGVSKVTAIGATLDDVADSQVQAFPVAGDYEIYVDVTYSDAGGTFTSGAGGYDYDSTVKVGANVYVTDTYGPATGALTRTTPADAGLPAYTPPAGWEVYSVDYSASIGYYTYVNQSVSEYVRAESYSKRSNYVSVLNGVPGTATQGAAGANNTAAVNKTEATYDPTYLDGQIRLQKLYSGSGTMKAELRINNPQATIYIRKPITNSSTAANDLKISSYDYVLSGFTQISSGTLNWQAIG